MATLPGCIDLADADTSPGRTIVLRELRELEPSSMPVRALRATIDESLAELQASVEAINAVILHLRQLRNAAVSATSLPSEVLARIFFFSPFTSPGERDIVTVSHVCKWWRAVALDHRWLWETLTVTSLDKADTFERRAWYDIRAIVIRDGAMFHLYALKLQTLLSGLLSLDIDIQGLRTLAFFMKYLNSLRQRVAPRLETLRVVGRYQSSELGTINDFHVRATIPSHWFPEVIAPKASSLRTLRLNPLLPPWDSEIYKNLSVLELGGPPTGPQLSEMALLKILRQCPALARLLLELPLTPPLPPAEANDPQWKVALPLLSLITLHHIPHTVVSQLLSRLVLPNSTRYEIVGGTKEILERLSSPTDSSARLANSESKDFRMVEILTGLPGEDDILSYSFLTVPTSSRTKPTMTLCMPDTLPGAEECAIRLGIPESVDVLKFRGSAGMPPDLDWTRIFQSTTYLRALHVMYPGGTLVGMLKPLGPPGVNHILARHDDTPGAGWLCPELESLQLVGAVFSAEMEGLIVGLLRDRAEVGLALKTVEFARSDGPSVAFLGRIQALGVAVRITESSPEWYADTTTFAYNF